MPVIIPSMKANNMRMIIPSALITCVLSCIKEVPSFTVTIANGTGRGLRLRSDDVTTCAIPVAHASA